MGPQDPAALQGGLWGFCSFQQRSSQGAQLLSLEKAGPRCDGGAGAAGGSLSLLFTVPVWPRPPPSVLRGAPVLPRMCQPAQTVLLEGAGGVSLVWADEAQLAGRLLSTGVSAQRWPLVSASEVEFPVLLCRPVQPD